jgi:hypothetical protein
VVGLVLLLYFQGGSIELVALWLVCCGCDAGVSAALFGGYCGWVVLCFDKVVLFGCLSLAH